MFIKLFIKKYNIDSFMFPIVDLHLIVLVNGLLLEFNVPGLIGATNFF